MTNENLRKELKEKFMESKKELKFRSSLKEMDEIFFIEDAVLSFGYVSSKFSRQLCRRMCETYFSWIDHLHRFIFPNSNNILTFKESEMFNEEEKNEILDLINNTMGLISKNSLIGLTKDKKEEAKFIDESVKFWKKSFCPDLIKIFKKINEGWENNTKEFKIK